jgi:hypothetical protein
MGAFKDQIYFAPGYNADPQNLWQYQLQAEVNWGSAWPEAGKEINTDRDKWFMQQLAGRGYIGTVSPLFYAGMPGKVGCIWVFLRYGAYVQNWIWRGDNFLYGARWDQLLSMRDKSDIVQVVSWNDYGESTYINEMVGDWPQSVKDAGYISSDCTHHYLIIRCMLILLSRSHSAAFSPSVLLSGMEEWCISRHQQGSNLGHGTPTSGLGRRQRQSTAVSRSGQSSQTCQTGIH